MSCRALYFWERVSDRVPSGYSVSRRGACLTAESMTARRQLTMKSLVKLTASLSLLALVGACTPEEVPSAAEEEQQTEEAAAQEQLGEDEQEGAPAGSASVSDVTLATDALMRLVADGETDARRFDIRVEGGVVTLTPDEGLEERLVERARGLVAEIDGVSDVVIPGRAQAQQQEEDAVAAEQALADAQPENSGAPDTEAAVDAAAELGAPVEREEGAEAEAADPEEEPAAPVQVRSYTVRPGDSLSGIAAREMGSGSLWRELYEFNRQVIGPNPDGLREGMEIRIPPVED